MLKRGFQFAPGYQLQEFLGRGQFGQVWRATAPGGAAAAVKFIDLSDGQGQKEYDGVRRVKQIRHANLMPITAIWLLDGEGKVIEEAPDEAIETIDLSVAEPRGASALLKKKIEPSWLAVSMLLGGQSLQARLRECIDEGLPGVPPKELISYMDESAKGLDFLNAPQHDLGEGPIAIQHSDVKPANIVLIGSSAVVCDFGLARILTRNQVTATSAAGTPAYMAPEAISGKPCRTSDQYSLAVTYYHLRTGTLPVNDGSLWEVLDAHRQGNLKLGLVAEAEQEVLRKATDLNWEDRFDTNVEMVDALREALRSEGHTKPSFVPKSGRIATAGGPTVDVADDPTATIDTAMLKPPTAPSGDAETKDQAGVATQPFVQADQETGENFLDETLPQLEQQKPEASSSKSDAAESFLDSIKRQPKVLTGIAAGVVVLLIVGAMKMSGGDQAPDQTTLDPNPSLGEDVAVPIVPAPDPQSAFAEAIAKFDTNEMESVALAKSALKADQGLAFLEPLVLKHHASVEKLLFSSDGKYLVSAGSNPSLALWNLTLPEFPATTLDGHDQLLNAIVLSPDGNRLLSVGFAGVPRVWNLGVADVAGSALELAALQDSLMGATWHPSDPIVVTTSNEPSISVSQLGLASAEAPNGTVAKQGKFDASSELKENAVAIDSKGRWLATISDPFGGDPRALVYRWSEVIGTFTKAFAPSPIDVAPTRNARFIGFVNDDPDGNAMLAIADQLGEVSLYALKDGENSLIARAKGAHADEVTAMRIARNANEDVVVTGSLASSVHWWKTGAAYGTKSVQLDEQPMGIASVDVSADGRWVAFCQPGSAWLWDTSLDSTGNLGAPHALAQLPTSGRNPTSVRIDPSHRWLAAGCADGSILLWDLTTAKLISIAGPSTPGLKSGGKIQTIEIDTNEQI